MTINSAWSIVYNYGKMVTCYNYYKKVVPLSDVYGLLRLTHQ